MVSLHFHDFWVLALYRTRAGPEVVVVPSIGWGSRHVTCVYTTGRGYAIATHCVKSNFISIGGSDSTNAVSD